MFVKRYINGQVFDEATDDTNPGSGGAAAGDSTSAGGDSGAGAGDAGATGASKEGDKKLSEKEHELLREVMTKKQKIKELEAAFNETQAKLKQFEGINLDEVRALLAEKQEIETKKLESKGEFDKVKAQMREQHQAEVKTLAQQIEELSNQLKGRDSVIDELSIGHAFSSSKYINEKLVLPPSKARTVFGAHFERNEKGEIVAYDKPKGAQNRAPLVDADGDPLPFDAAIAKLVDRDPDKDLILRAAVKPGAGSGTSTVTGGNTQGSDLTGASRIAASLREGGLKKSGLKLMK